MARTTLRPPPSADTPELVASRRRHPSANRRQRARRPPPPIQFYGLATIITILVMLGLVMVLSASSVLSLHTDGSAWTYFVKQLLWAALGIVALFVTLKVPYNTWRPLIPLALAGSFALMIVSLAPGIGVTANGARAWIRVGPFTLQPSELLKLALLLYCADLLARRADRMNDVRHTLYPMLVVLGAGGLLVMLQSDLGGALVLCAVVLGVAFVAGTPLVPLGATLAGVSLFGFVFVSQSSYRRARWLAFLDLAQHKRDAGWQVWQSLIGIASGGVTGVGLGASKSKWGYLPEAHTDFIFAIIAEELGFVGVLAVCGLFCMFGLFGVQVALRSRDRFGMLVAGGVTAWILTQALINIGGVVGMMPLTGLTLPFVSFGGSSLLVTMAAGGLLLNIARNNR
jgi:cell division protein FtsW